MTQDLGEYFLQRTVLPPLETGWDLVRTGAPLLAPEDLQEGEGGIRKEEGGPGTRKPGDPAAVAEPSAAAPSAGKEIRDAASSGQSLRARVEQGGSVEVIVFLLGGQPMGVEILQVREIIRMPRVTPTPKAPPYLKGVVNLRESVVPVVDLRDVLGMASRDEARYLMILRVNGLTVGVPIEGIVQVMKVNADALEAYHTDLLKEGGAHLWGVVKVGDRLVSLLDLPVVFESVERLP